VDAEGRGFLLRVQGKDVHADGIIIARYLSLFESNRVHKCTKEKRRNNCAPFREHEGVPRSLVPCQQRKSIRSCTVWYLM
jgi:hypothetical protein